MNKKKIILILLTALSVLLIYLLFARRNEISFDIVTISRNDVVEEIFESGIIKKGDEINLSFKGSGSVKEVIVREGDFVSKGDILMRLSDDELQIQLARVRSNLRSMELNLSKVMTGAGSSDVLILQTMVVNAENGLHSAQQNLINTINLTDQRSAGFYRDTLTSLNNAWLRSEVASNVVDTISKKYFTNFWIPEVGRGRNLNDNIKKSFNEIKDYRDLVSENRTQENIDTALRGTENSLISIFNDIEEFLQILNEPVFHNVAQADLDSLSNQKNLINQSIGTTSSLIGSISLIRASNSSELNLAQAQVLSAQGALNQAQNELSKATSPLRGEDLGQAQSLVRQAQAEVDLIIRAIEDTSIKAPFNGTVLSVNYKENEFVQPGLTVASMMSEDEHHVEVNIYEGDIARIDINNEAEIEIVAFPGIIFSGEVVFIDPSAKILDGVVYYRVLISIDDSPDRVLPGMTVDAVILANKKESVVSIPDSALRREFETPTIFIWDDGNITEREIGIGLRGTNRMIEVVSGLNEGEMVVIR